MPGGVAAVATAAAATAAAATAGAATAGAATDGAAAAAGGAALAAALMEPRWPATPADEARLPLPGVRRFVPSDGID